MKKLLMIIACAMTYTMGNASADEVWTSTYGEVVFADELGPTAVWTYEHNGQPSAIYILGLAGIYSERGSYDGYWAQNGSDVKCSTPRPSLYNQKTYYWGKFHIVFLDNNFPSRWQAKWGYCDDTPTRSWDGSPRG